MNIDIDMNYLFMGIDFETMTNLYFNISENAMKTGNRNNKKAYQNGTMAPITAQLALCVTI